MYPCGTVHLGLPSADALHSSAYNTHHLPVSARYLSLPFLVQLFAVVEGMMLLRGRYVGRKAAAVMGTQVDGDRERESRERRWERGKCNSQWR